ncbi:MAG: hypothetical protein IJX87_06115 [Clostridia bacterium]|nr:hypothetical protein [Clostridia bacterium]
MLLSELIGKNLCAGKGGKDGKTKTVRGVCRGIGVSSKNFSVKYLLCAEQKGNAGCAADFSVNLSAVETIGEEIYLFRLRPVYPKNCIKFFLGQPIYSVEGSFLGHVADVELQNMVATKLYTDRDTAHSVLCVAACHDAVILRKEQPFPIGQRIPAPVVLKIFDKNEAVVTKPILRGAMQRGMLVRLTLSLPPFDCGFVEFQKPKHRFFL